MPTEPLLRSALGPAPSLPALGRRLVTSSTASAASIWSLLGPSSRRRAGRGRPPTAAPAERPPPARSPQLRDVGELPPPQRLDGRGRPRWWRSPCASSLAMPARSSEIRLGRTSGARTGRSTSTYVVDRPSSVGQPLAQPVDVGVGAGVGLVPSVGAPRRRCAPSRAPASRSWETSSSRATPPAAGVGLRGRSRAAPSRNDSTWSATSWAKPSSSVARWLYSSSSAWVSIEHSPPFECSAERDLVGVLQVAAHRQSTRQPGHAQPQSA